MVLFMIDPHRQLILDIGPESNIGGALMADLTLVYLT